jgi:hypothetical protein
MLTIEEAAARILKISMKEMGLARASRLESQTQIVKDVLELAAAFGIPEPQVFVVDQDGIGIVPGSPSAVLVSRKVAALTDERASRFIAASILQYIRQGLSLATVVPSDRLRTLLAGVVRLFVSDFCPPGITPSAVEQAAALLGQSLPGRSRDAVQQFAFDCAEALGEEDLDEQIVNVGHRAGFVASGALTAAIDALCATTGVARQPLSGIPGAALLISFVFSKDHLELRRRLGLRST